MWGSRFQDVITYNNRHFARQSNNMGGIEGGMSNGEDIVCRVYHKPISTLGALAKTVDIKTHRPAPTIAERSDVCVVPRAGVISEAMLTLVLGQTMIEKFGGDHIDAFNPAMFVDKNQRFCNPVEDVLQHGFAVLQLGFGKFAIRDFFFCDIDVYLQVEKALYHL